MRPEVFRGFGVGDADINAQHPRTAALSAAGYEIFDSDVAWLSELVEIGRLVCQALYRKPAAVPQKVAGEIVRENVKKGLLIGLTR